MTLAERTAFMNAWISRIEKANHIVVVGGGPVGLDIVGTQLTSSHHHYCMSVFSFLLPKSGLCVVAVVCR